MFELQAYGTEETFDLDAASYSGAMPISCSHLDDEEACNHVYNPMYKSASINMLCQVKLFVETLTPSSARQHGSAD